MNNRIFFWMNNQFDFWMNILDLILNWIIFGPDSTFEWITKTNWRVLGEARGERCLREVCLLLFGKLSLTHSAIQLVLRAFTQRLRFENNIIWNCFLKEFWTKLWIEYFWLNIEWMIYGMNISDWNLKWILN